MINSSTGSMFTIRHWQQVGVNSIVKLKGYSRNYRPLFSRLSLLLCPLLLVGCVAPNGQSPLSVLTQPVLPDDKVIDYRYANCDSIWNMEQVDARENPLYWLRMMDCADPLSTQQARTDANQIDATNWWQIFQQSILLNAADPSAAERRKTVDNLNLYSLQFPVAVRPLLQLWRERQVQSINLAEMSNRFKLLQQDTDGKLDRLKEENARLAFELKNTSRKLENLADIERQLSSRKQTQSSTNSDMDKHPDENKVETPAAEIKPDTVPTEQPKEQSKEQ